MIQMQWQERGYLDQSFMFMGIKDMEALKVMFCQICSYQKDDFCSQFQPKVEEQRSKDFTVVLLFKRQFWHRHC